MSIDVTPTREKSLAELVAEEIRVLLTRRRIRQSQLARALGVNDQWVSVRLRGVQPLDLDELERIAKVLEVPVVDLLPRLASAERPAGNSRWYERAAQRSIARTPDPVTRRPRDSRPVGRPSGSLKPVPGTGVRRPQRRYAALPDAHLQVNVEKISA